VVASSATNVAPIGAIVDRAVGGVVVVVLIMMLAFFFGRRRGLSKSLEEPTVAAPSEIQDKGQLADGIASANLN
jgi:hypothetical protein